jgi:hypothetical protein
MKRTRIRKIIGGLSFTSALFIFQACYGTPQDLGYDLLVEGQVKSKTSGLPVKGIKVSVFDNVQYETTDEHGYFSFYTGLMENLKIQFQDIDSTQNGLYANKDTLLYNATERVYLDITLEDK